MKIILDVIHILGFMLENFLLAKSDQPKWEKNDSWKDEFELD